MIFPLDEENSLAWATAQKWCSLVVGSLSDYMPMKERIQRSYQIRDYGLRALKILKDDPKIPHMLARWCMTVAGVGWVERKIAATFFAKVPTATFDEAIEYFLQAETLDPLFIRNYHFLAETYVKMGKKNEAKKAFARV
jgi:tetratricopeptide (TPR) repeat protein